MVQFMNRQQMHMHRYEEMPDILRSREIFISLKCTGEHWLWQKWKVFQMQKMLQTQISTDSIFMKEHYVQEMKRIHLLRQRDIIIRKIQYIQGMRGIFLHCLQMRGLAWSAFYTDRFYPEEVIGRTVVIHGMADDFRTQSSGNSGSKIACGEIVSE